MAEETPKKIETGATISIVKLPPTHRKTFTENVVDLNDQLSSYVQTKNLPNSNAPTKTELKEKFNSVYEEYMRLKYRGHKLSPDEQAGENILKALVESPPKSDNSKIQSWIIAPLQKIGARLGMKPLTPQEELFASMIENSGIVIPKGITVINNNSAPSSATKTSPIEDKGPSRS